MTIRHCAVQEFGERTNNGSGRAGTGRRPSRSSGNGWPCREGQRRSAGKVRIGRWNGHGVRHAEATCNGDELAHARLTDAQIGAVEQGVDRDEELRTIGRRQPTVNIREPGRDRVDGSRQARDIEVEVGHDPGAADVELEAEHLAERADAVDRRDSIVRTRSWGALETHVERLVGPFWLIPANSG